MKKDNTQKFSELKSYYQGKLWLMYTGIWGPAGQLANEACKIHKICIMITSGKLKDEQVSAELKAAVGIRSEIKDFQKYPNFETQAKVLAPLIDEALKRAFEHLNESCQYIVSENVAGLGQISSVFELTNEQDKMKGP